MAENLTSKIPAILLLLVGLTIVVGSAPQIYAAVQDHDSFQIEEIDGFDDSQCQTNESVDPSDQTSEQICYEFNQLSDAEQRIVRRGLNRSGTFEGPEASELEHFESGLDAPGPGHGIYYVEKGGVYYQLTVSSGGWGDGIALLVVFIPAFLLGILDVGVGLLSLDDRFTIAGPTALLAGHALLFGPFLLRWGGFDVRVPHLGILLLAALVVTGTTFLGFEIRRKVGLRRR